MFALFVLAVRRATILATAMESRGFGVSRRAHLGPAEPAARAATPASRSTACSIAVGATAAGLAAGTWHLVLA